MLYASSGCEMLRVVHPALALVYFPTRAVVHDAVDVVHRPGHVIAHQSPTLSLSSSITPLIGLVFLTGLPLSRMRKNKVWRSPHLCAHHCLPWCRFYVVLGENGPLLGPFSGTIEEFLLLVLTSMRVLHLCPYVGPSGDDFTFTRDVHPISLP